MDITNCPVEDCEAQIFGAYRSTYKVKKLTVVTGSDGGLFDVEWSESDAEEIDSEPTEFYCDKGHDIFDMKDAIAKLGQL